PPLTLDLTVPSSQPPGPVPAVHPGTPKPGAVPTMTRVTENLRPLGRPTIPPPNFVASINEAPTSIRFEIAVNHGGEIAYSFARNSSGDPSLDEQGRQYLALCRFPTKPGSSDAELIWGTAWI